ncbi:KTSC domain-containing protein [Mesorhizobium sp. M0618]|uniref:KTSC domain-containing protein n=2 Tax=unclassified Mesorhizobium TaxID=325217 RepID=UPI00333C50A6
MGLVRMRPISRHAEFGPANWCSMPSTSIRKFDYEPNTRILSVWFVASGKHYEFLDVPVETFTAFKAAFAKGRYFNDHVRNRYPFRLVT